MIRRTIIFVATVWRMAILYAVFFAKYDAWADLFRQYRAALVGDFLRLLRVVESLLS